jgi:predicted dehydrogenase
MYKCAFLGCGPRARGHARAYKNIQRGRIVAICDLDEKRLQAFGDEFGVATRYRDVHEMLTRERPDVLHLVTLPGLRVPLMRLAAEHQVPLAVVEKPIALWGEDYRQIKALGESSQTRFVVNTQLYFHARNLELKRDVGAGRIGEVRHIDVSARSTPLDQGVHVLELAHSYTGFAPITRVFGNVSGAANLTSRQPAPDMAEACLDFANGVHASFITGACAPVATTQESICHHKRVSVFGTRGFVQWTMWWWERLVDGRYERGEHNYGIEDDLAQARLTEAAFDWLEDPAKPHPTRLETNLVQFNAILGIYVSALQAAPVSLPFDPPDRLCEALAARLARP